MSRERKHEITRLEAFSDAVFGFALTLLVVSLQAPHTFPELMQLLWGFLPFGGCFALLVYIWYEHTAFFRTYGLNDRMTTVLNAVLLFVVLFYVYPLKYLFTLMFAMVVPQLRHEGAPRTLDDVSKLFAVYGIGFVAVFGVFALLYYWAWRRRDDLGLTPVEARDARGEIGTHMVSVTIGLVSILWALLAPGNLRALAGFIYFAMGPMHWAYGTVNGRRRRRFLDQAAAPGR